MLFGGRGKKREIRDMEKLYLHAALETLLMCSVMYGEEGAGYFSYFFDKRRLPDIKGQSPVLLWTH